MCTSSADLGSDDWRAAGWAWQVFATVDAQIVLKLALIANTIKIIAESRTVAANSLIDDKIDCFVQPDNFRLRQIMGPRFGMQPSPGKALIDINVSQPADKGLIKQQTLNFLHFSFEKEKMLKKKLIV